MGNNLARPFNRSGLNLGCAGDLSSSANAYVVVIPTSVPADRSLSRQGGKAGRQIQFSWDLMLLYSVRAYIRCSFWVANISFPAPPASCLPTCLPLRSIKASIRFSQCRMWATSWYEV